MEQDFIPCLVIEKCFKCHLVNGASTIVAKCSDDLTNRLIQEHKEEGDMDKVLNNSLYIYESSYLYYDHYYRRTGYFYHGGIVDKIDGLPLHASPAIMESYKVDADMEIDYMLNVKGYITKLYLSNSIVDEMMTIIRAGEYPSIHICKCMHESKR